MLIHVGYPIPYSMHVTDIEAMKRDMEEAMKRNQEEVEAMQQSWEEKLKEQEAQLKVK